jgi:hypothetical protein
MDISELISRIAAVLTVVISVAHLFSEIPATS